MATVTVSEKSIDTVRLPSVSDRTVIIGRTGSGKTYGGLWHLSLQPIDDMPWIVVDFKRDENIASLPYAQFISMNELPEFPGIYIVQPRPTMEDKQRLSEMMDKILDRGFTGIFVDEGYMMAKDDAFNTILMQGRSKNIPVIVNTQRPVYISRYVFSEASFIQVFAVIDSRDKKTIAEFTSLEQDFRNLPEYHSYYYDVALDRLHVFKPVPDASISMTVIANKLRPLYEERTSKMRVFI